MKHEITTCPCCGRPITFSFPEFRSWEALVQANCDTCDNHSIGETEPEAAARLASYTSNLSFTEIESIRHSGNK